MVMKEKQSVPQFSILLSFASRQVVGLVRIVIHTIAAHSHVCDKYVKPMTGFAVRLL